jgi:transcriptional antiterminator NusG
MDNNTNAINAKDTEPHWYVLHTYNGYETMVKDNLAKLVENNRLEDYIFEVQIPMEDVVEEKNGKRKIVQRKRFPCYVLIKMIYTNNIWFLVTNTKGVTGFVGPGGRPLPLTEEEVKRMRLESKVVNFNMNAGDDVKIISGPLMDFVGKIESIDLIREQAKVMVSMFGRQTPVELDLVQIEKL